MTYETKQMLVNFLLEAPPTVLSTAYIYAKNYVDYGDDVTKAWTTAVRQSAMLEKAYNKGYYDAMQRQAESEPQESEEKT